MAFNFLIMGAMAASAAMGQMGRKAQYKNARQATELEEHQIDLRMKQERLAFQEQGVASIENLREVMASTQALFAAQGRMPGIGTTDAIQRRSVTAFNRDETSRALSLGFREQYVRSQKAVGRLGLQGLKKQHQAESFKSAFDLMNFSSFGGGGGGGGSGTKAPVETRFTSPAGSRSPLAGLRGGTGG